MEEEEEEEVGVGIVRKVVKAVVGVGEGEKAEAVSVLSEAEVAEEARKKVSVLFVAKSVTDVLSGDSVVDEQTRRTHCIPINRNVNADFDSFIVMVKWMRLFCSFDF